DLLALAVKAEDLRVPRLRPRPEDGRQAQRPGQQAVHDRAHGPGEHSPPAPAPPPSQARDRLAVERVHLVGVAGVADAARLAVDRHALAVLAAEEAATDVEGVVTVVALGIAHAGRLLAETARGAEAPGRAGRRLLRARALVAGRAQQRAQHG